MELSYRRKGICLIWSRDRLFPPSLPCPGGQVSESNLEPSPASNPVALPVLYFYWSLYPVAAIVLSEGFIVSILLPIVSFSNHRLRLERYRLSLSSSYKRSASRNLGVNRHGTTLRQRVQRYRYWLYFFSPFAIWSAHARMSDDSKTFHVEGTVTTL